MRNETSSRIPGTGTVDFKLEVVVVPVSDADRAKRFYASLGWREDADFVISEDYRVLQFTPTGSQASIIFGTGVTDATPGSIDSLVVAVDDIDAARAELIERGVDVSDVFHDAGGGLGGGFHAGSRGPLLCLVRVVQRPGRQRLAAAGDHRATPGAGVTMDVATLAQLLRETAEHHHDYEKVAPPHDWWDWYAPYLSAREEGSSAEQASAVADRYMRDVRGVVIAR
jgi:catechol 2,3-dioxygenase-like lactoylglutathione lyase family enzyme